MRRTSSGGIAAPPMPPTRSCEKSVRARSGCASTSSHCVGTPGAHRDALVADEAQRLGRRPRLAGDHDRRRVRELVPHARHVADVREREHDEPPVPGSVSWPMLREIAGLALRGRRPRPSARRSSRSSTRCRWGRSASSVREALAAGRRRSARLERVDARGRGRGRRPSGSSAPSPRTVTWDRVRARMLACLVRTEPEVDRGGDRADAQRAEVAGGELDRRGRA